MKGLGNEAFYFSRQLKGEKRMKPKHLKFVGMAISLLGLLATAASDWIDGYCTEKEIAEQVEEAFRKRESGDKQ